MHSRAVSEHVELSRGLSVATLKLHGVRDSYRVARVIAAGSRTIDGIVLIVGIVANILELSVLYPSHYSASSEPERCPSTSHLGSQSGRNT